MLARALRGLGPTLPLLTEIGQRFADAGHELALVGGPVRDSFLGRVSPDLDFTTSARPEQIEQVLTGWADQLWDVGRRFGTIGARRRGTTVEVTTYRADAYEPGTRKPVVAFGDDLAEDLVRRDFTVNAMALRLPELSFVDPHDGLADLAARTLRTPHAPEVSFSDDPLRMMRAARFVSQLGFAVDPATRRAMTDMAGRLQIVSAERVREELNRLLLGRYPRAGLEVLVDSGLADVVLPELPALRLEVDEHHRHKDVYQHSLTVLEQAIDLEDPPGADGDDPDAVPGPDLVLRLAALLHDIGKPATRRFEPGGGVSFHHHEVVGAKMARKRLRALRYDNETTRQVARLVELHLRFHGYGTGEWTDSAVRRYITDAGPLLGRLHKLTRSDCTTRNRRKAARLARAYQDLEERIERLQAEEELAAVRPELNGHEIGELLGIRPGPLLGRAYQHLLATRLDQGPMGKEAARQELLRWWAEQPESGQPESGQPESGQPESGQPESQQQG
nr:CCA tRNA nucleotidyltransferase [Ornithinicoccus halotolerans]